MRKVDISTVFYEYRGRYYEYRSAGSGWVTIVVSGEQVSDCFPDAIEQSSDADDAWVKLPLQVIGDRRTRTVRAVWNGLPVFIDDRIETGVDRGDVVVRFDGLHPVESPHPDFQGNQRDGWWGIVDSNELHSIDVEWDSSGGLQ